MISKKIGVIALAASLSLAGAGLAFAEATTTSSSWNSAIAGPSTVGSSLEMHINNNGTVTIRGAKITSISGSTINATQSWGSYSTNWVINAANAELILRYGGKATLGDYSVGDYIGVNGKLDTTQSAPTIIASVIRDYSSQRQHATFAGTISSVNSSNSSFVLPTNRGNITVFVSASTTLKLGDASTTFSSIVVGQKVTKASGVWDTLTNQLQADTVVIATNTGLLSKRTFEGTLGTLAASTSPTSFTYSVGSSNYTVNVASNTLLLSNSWNTISLGQIKSGDKVRVYGAVEAANQSIIDAMIVRDTNIH